MTFAAVGWRTAAVCLAETLFRKLLMLSGSAGGPLSLCGGARRRQRGRERRESSHFSTVNGFLINGSASASVSLTVHTFQTPRVKSFHGGIQSYCPRARWESRCVAWLGDTGLASVELPWDGFSGQCVTHQILIQWVKTWIFILWIKGLVTHVADWFHIYKLNKAEWFTSCLRVTAGSSCVVSHHCQTINQ